MRIFNFRRKYERLRREVRLTPKATIFEEKLIKLLLSI